MDDSQVWYYGRGDVQTGPLSYAELGEAVRAGQCEPSDLVWREGMPDWQPASTAVPELFVAPPDPYAAPAEPTAPDEPAAWPQSPTQSQQQTQPLPPPQQFQPYVPPPYAQPGMTPLPYAGPVSYGGQSYQGMAIGGFVCSLVALPASCCVSFLAIPLSITGLVLGILAKKGMKRTGNPQGQGLALAAIILGITGIALVAGLVVFYIVAMAMQP